MIRKQLARFSNRSRFMGSEESAAKVKHPFPWVTLLLSGTSIGVYYCWQTWPHRKSRTHLIFCETNFYNLKQYQTLLISPLSYENNFFFYCSLPGLAYSSFLVERYLGARTLLLSYFANCLASAATTVYVHRQIGFHKVNQRGRMSNTNGNTSLFLSMMFTTLVPGYMMMSGKSVMSQLPFGILAASYFLLFFSNHLSDPTRRDTFKHA